MAIRDKIKRRVHRVGEYFQQIPTPEQPLNSSANDSQSGKKTAWKGLDTLAGVLGEGASGFGPLKSAVDGIFRCIDIFERESKGRKDYETLRKELNLLFEDLSEYVGGPAPLGLTSSMENLTKGIEREIELVQQKRERNKAERYAEAMDDADEILECYRRIQTLLARLTLNANVNIWKIVDEQATEYRLKSLSHSSAAWYSSAQSNNLGRDGCTPNTRVEVLGGLGAWADDPLSEKIYWLNGMAGTGKTTIACSLCKQLDGARKLAASFFCSRQLPECRDANLIFPTLAYQLARLSRPFRYALSGSLERNPDVQDRQLSEQFAMLILEPLHEIAQTLPSDLVVVIDALDECEDEGGVGRILDVLLLNASALSVKFFVTSRPEALILKRMRTPEGERVSSELRLHDLDHSIVREDIKTYLRVNLECANLSASDLETLVAHSGVLFIYAATVVRYISVKDFSWSSQRLKQVLGVSSSTPHGSYKEIDGLYTAILGAAFDNPILEEREREAMLRVLHTVVCAQEPLTVDVITGLLKLETRSSVNAALQPLFSVLYVSETTGPVTTLHESFPDYIFTQERSGRFHCDRRRYNTRLAQLCFNQIKLPDPPFNICSLESSHVFDEDVPDLDKKVDGAISKELFYACRYWGVHLQFAQDPASLAEALKDFLSERFLVWMEVMNLKQCMGTGAGVLYQLQAQFQDVNGSNDIGQLAEDAWRFVIAFISSPAHRSTPHIYISALPFWPEQRAVSRCYQKKMTGLVKAEGTAMGRRETAPVAVWNTESVVRCVAWSSDGARIASGFNDNTIRTWDAHTGLMVGQPLEGHNDMVNSVAYSSDSAHIISGSDDMTVRIWDAYTGLMIGQPLKGHTQMVLSVAYSPNGENIVSGSADKTIRIWDVHTGLTVGQPLEGHSDMVNSVAYSSDSKHIVSGSEDSTIRIWDAHTGLMVCQPLVGHTQTIFSVAYSSNGARIVSGSEDNTVRIWDAHSGLMVGQPLEGHTTAVWSVAYSSDGARIVSGSEDNTIRIWDAQTGLMIGQPLEGHTGLIYSVAYSPDGAHVVSSSFDKTIRIWDAQAGLTASPPLEGHVRRVRSVAYSSDGIHIVSGSEDFTVRIWDARTGLMVGQPFKGHSLEVCSVAYFPNSTRVVSGSEDNTIRIWDTNTGLMVGEPLTGHFDWVGSVACSSDGSRIVSGSEDNTVRIWDAQTGLIIGRPLKGHTRAVYSVAYSSDGTRVASGSVDQTIRIWDAQTGLMIGQPLEGHTKPVLSVAFSSDGARIVSSSEDHTIRIWNAHTGLMVGQPLKGHTSWVRSVAYSSDGSRIVSGSDDYTVRIWDPHTGLMVGQPLEGHTSVVDSVAFSPDDARVVSGSWDNNIRIWDARTSLIVGQPEQTQSARNSCDTRRTAVDDDSPIENLDSVTTQLHDTWTLREDGWVVADESNLLIWVPPELRDALMFPPQRVLISRGNDFVRFDFSNAKVGKSWRQCYHPA